MAEANFFDQFDAPTAPAQPPAAAVPTPTNPDGTQPLRFTVRPKGVEPPPAEAAPSNYFDQFDVSPTIDVAKSTGVGLGKGLIALGGTPGDARELATLGASKLAKLFGFDVPQETLDTALKAVPVIGTAPTSAEIRKPIEEITGEFYTPQTRQGEYAQTAAEFVPGAFTGPAGGVRAAAANAVKLGVLPGLASEWVGGILKNGPYAYLEPYVRAATAIGTGGTAAALTRPSSAANAIRGQLPDYVTEAHVGQAAALIDDAAARGVRLTWPEALSQVTGRPVLTDVQRFLESAPATRARMQEVHGGRPQEIAQAAENEFGAFGPGTNAPSTIGPAAGAAAEEAVQGARQRINQAAEPFYTATEGVLLTPAEMRQVRAVPGYQEARNAVRNDPQLNRYVGHLPDNSVGFLNEVKKQLDRMAEDATNVLSPRGIPNQQRAAGLTSDAATVRQSAIDASGRAMQSAITASGSRLPPFSPYEVALNIEQQARRDILEPLLQGPLGKLAKSDITTQRAIDALFPESPLFGSADEISTAVSALAARNPWAARQLVRAHLEQKLDEAFNAAGRGQEAAQFAGAGFAHDVLGSPVIGTQKMQNVRAAVEALPNGPQIWNGLSRFFEIAQATGTRQPIGSKTEFNKMMRHDLSSGGALANVVKKGASPGKWWTWANDVVTGWQLGRNLDQLAWILTDPNSGRLLQRIAGAPRNSRDAQMTAARLAAGVNANVADTTKAETKQ